MKGPIVPLNPADEPAAERAARLKRYFLIQTAEGVSLAVWWFADAVSGAPQLRQIDALAWLDEAPDSADRTYAAARERWSHMLGK